MGIDENAHWMQLRTCVVYNSIPGRLDSGPHPILMPPETTGPGPAPSKIRLWIPSLLLLLLAPAEILPALRHFWFTDKAVDIHLRLMAGAIGASGVLAVIIVAWPKARTWTCEHLDRLGGASRGAKAAWLGIAYLGIFALLFWLKYCQYRGFQLPLDSAATGNICYNIAHRLSFACPLLGIDNYFAVHFVPLLAVLAPILLIWNSLLPLIIIETMLAASVPLAAYHLAYRKTGSSSAGFAALWLVFTSPFLFYLAGASVYPGKYMSYFFVWALVCAETGSWRLASVAFVLMALSVEQSCIAFFGLGAYLVLRLGANRRAWLIGTAIVLASACLFCLELKLRFSFPTAAGFRGWEMYSHWGPTPKAALASASAAPLQTLQLLFWPWARLKPAWDMRVSTGFLPLLTPASLVPWAINYLPGFLAGAGDIFHEGRLQYAGYFIGPLWWAAVLGLIKAHAWLARRQKAHWLLAFVLAAGAVNLSCGPDILLRKWASSYFSDGPRTAAAIPAEASLWAPQFMSSWVACRSFLQLLPGDDSRGKAFLPDYVLLDLSGPWMSTATPARDSVMTFLARESYAVTQQTWPFVWLKHPRAPLARPGGVPTPIELPPPDASGSEYMKRLLGTDRQAGAEQWTLRLAARGSEQAQYNLGNMYEQGLGVRQDHAEAEGWWRKAAEQGYAEAQNSLGVSAMNRGEWSAAAGWYRKAAEQGNAMAQKNLGICHVTGRGLARDIPEAIRWFRKAAEQDDDMAQYNLGVCLLSGGEATARDRDEAIYWLRKAAAQGNERAKAQLARLQGAPAP